MPNPKGHEDSIKNSRFKAAWRSGVTRTIRVPIALADATLDYARQLDRGVEPRDTASKINDKTCVDTTETLDTMLKEEGEDITQIKKELKAAAELHREERSMELEKIRWQRELSDAKHELADAKATILKQSDKIRNLERGYGFKETPTEKILRRQIRDLEQQLSDLKQNSAPIAIAAEFPDAAKLLSQLRGKRKKSKADLADIQTVLELLEN